MDRRFFLKTAAYCTAGAVSLRAWGDVPVSPKAKPNFIFILVDDMGWTGLSTVMDDRVPESQSDFYQTPRLAKFAEQSMRFSNAYAPSPMCTPTRASCLTGKSPAALHMTTPGRGERQPKKQRLIPPRHISSLPADVATIAEILKEQNYATAHFGKWHLSGGGPGAHGFESHDGDTGNGGPGTYTDPNPKDIFGITERATKFMEEQAKAHRPFYLQLSHYAVHEPSQALAKTKALFADQKPGRRHKDVSYAAMTRDLDTSVGILLDQIEHLGIADQTYVVFMSDNGAGNPRNPDENKPLNNRKGTLWEGGIRVPFMIRGPEIQPGSFCRMNVVGYDLMPTFCELANISVLPDGVEGQSLTPLLNGEPTSFKRKQAVFFHFPHYGIGSIQVPQSAILEGNWKLIKWYETGDAKLFDLSNDIGETTDLSSQHPEKARALDAELTARLKGLNAQFPIKNPNYNPLDARDELWVRRQNQSSGLSGGPANRTGPRGAGRPNRRQ